MEDHGPQRSQPTADRPYVSVQRILLLVLCPSQYQFSPTPVSTSFYIGLLNNPTPYPSPSQTEISPYQDLSFSSIPVGYHSVYKRLMYTVHIKKAHDTVTSPWRWKQWQPLKLPQYSQILLSTTIPKHEQHLHWFSMEVWRHLFVRIPPTEFHCGHSREAVWSQGTRDEIGRGTSCCLMGNTVSSVVSVSTMVACHIFPPCWIR
jgi:hypothetical protein